MWFFDGFGWTMMLFGLFSTLVFWGLVAWVIALIVRNANRGGTGRPGANRPADDAETLARRRFAAGEIDEAEFDRILRKLRDHTA